MKAGDTLICNIKRFESLRLKAYQDAKGVWTIGYGHTQNVQPGDVITITEAEALLRGDLCRYEEYVNSLDVCRDNQGRFDALTDFAYNCGITNLQGSNLLKYILENRSEDEIRTEFLRWCYSGTRRLNGLKKRRLWEANHFFNKRQFASIDIFVAWLRNTYNRMSNR